jgi:hypothetical protein
VNPPSPHILQIASMPNTRYRQESSSGEEEVAGESVGLWNMFRQMLISLRIIPLGAK